MRGRVLAYLAVAVLAVVGLVACFDSTNIFTSVDQDQNNQQGAASPAPGPSVSPSPGAEANCSLVATVEVVARLVTTGGPKVSSFKSGTNVVLDATPRGQDQQALDSRLHSPVFRWGYEGNAQCEFFGATSSANPDFRCITPGSVVVTGTNCGKSGTVALEVVK